MQPVDDHNIKKRCKSMVPMQLNAVKQIVSLQGKG